MKKRVQRDFAILSALLITTFLTSYEIYKRTYNNSLLISAVSTGDYDRVKEMLEIGANPNCRDNVGTPVILLAVNAPAIAGGYGHSVRGPRRYTVYKNHYEIVRLLVEKGADPNSKIEEGATPLNQALACGNSELVDFLVKNGATAQ